jgi:glutamate dehydrogenase/leucine dehydrogenase
MPTTHEEIAALIKAKVVFLDKVANAVGVPVSGFEMKQHTFGKKGKSWKNG